VLSGSAVFNKGLQVGYFAQHQVEMLRDDQSPLWHLKKLAPEVREQDLRNYLGSFNFPARWRPARSSISPAARRRASRSRSSSGRGPTCCCSTSRPTTSTSRRARRWPVALAQFEGTLVLVSHDRHLLRATTDQFLIVADGTLQAFDGDLEDYREWLLKRNIAPKPVPEKKAAPKKPKLQNRKPIEARIKRLEELMARLNTQKSEIDAKLGDPKVYQDGEALKALLHDQAYVVREIEQVEAEWLAKQAELEQP
jgi:ATP-binding cassette subfamily F protein 3